MTQGMYSIGLLVCSNIFMTLAWYGHLKMKEEFSWFAALPLLGVIIFSWCLAFFEYCLQVPANRIGFKDNGGPFDIMQLKVIQEVITLTVFTVFSIIAFHIELKWNHLWAALCLIAAVYFAFRP
ncbi:DMT family protein [Succinatimonas hippei]|uniref:DMT family protein n=1 Tax=Succinatimonas hippei TaxID=626938 RepID=UPI0031EEB7AA